jgi:hypothetical protein
VSGDEVVGFVTFGFSLSMVMFFCQMFLGACRFLPASCNKNDTDIIIDIRSVTFHSF